MIDINRPVRTRDGREVVGLRIRQTTLTGYMVRGQAMDLYSWYWSGKVNNEYETPMDLVNIEVQP